MLKHLLLFLLGLSLSAAEPEIVHKFLPGQYPGWTSGGGTLSVKQTPTALILQTPDLAWARLRCPVKLTPGRTYRVRLQGEGPVDLLYRKNRAKAFYDFEARDVFRNGPIFEAEFTTDAETPATGVLFLRPAKRNVPVTLERFELKPLGPEPPAVPFTAKERAQVPPPETVRGVVFQDGMLTEKRAAAAAAGHANLVRLRFRGNTALRTARECCELARKYHLKVTLEFMQGGEALTESERLYTLIRDYADVIWAVRPGQEPLPQELVKFRSEFPHIWLLRDLTAYLPAEIVRDLRTVYGVSISSPADLHSLKTLLNCCRVPVLATVTPEMASGTERALVNWTIPATDRTLPKVLTGAERLFVLNAPAEAQDASLIRAVRSARTPDAIVFGMITDVHYQTDHLPYEEDDKLAETRHHFGRDQSRHFAVLAKRLNVDFIANTGDIINGFTTRKTAMNDLAAVMAAMAESGVPVLATKGNHDDGSHYAIEFANGNPAEALTEADWHGIVTAEALKAGAKGDPARPGANYYYMDFPKQKIRVIVLNQSENPLAVDKAGKIHDKSIAILDVGIPQISWLAHTALNFRNKPDKKEWRVLFFSHANLSRDTMMNMETLNGVLAAYLSGGKYSGESFPSGSGFYPGKVSCDFTDQGPMRILCVLHGDLHEAWRWEKPVHNGAFREYLFPCAKPSENPVVTRPRTMGTPAAESFSFVVLDPVRETMKIFRYGSGWDESYNTLCDQK